MFRPATRAPPPSRTTCWTSSPGSPRRPASPASGAPDVTTYLVQPCRTRCSTASRAPASPPTEAAPAAARCSGRSSPAGRPFLWWTTPSTTSPRLEPALGLPRAAARRLPRHAPRRSGLTAPAAVRGPAPGVEVPAVPSHDRVLRRGAGRRLRHVRRAGWSRSPAVRRASTPPGCTTCSPSSTASPRAAARCGSPGRTAGLYNIALARAGARARGRHRRHEPRWSTRPAGWAAPRSVLHATRRGSPSTSGWAYVEVLPAAQHVWVAARLLRSRHAVRTDV